MPEIFYKKCWKSPHGILVSNIFFLKNKKKLLPNAIFRAMRKVQINTFFPLAQILQLEMYILIFYFIIMNE